MNKNVIFVYGEGDARRVLISYLRKEKRDDNIYLTIDALNNVLGITRQDGEEFPMRLQSLISRSSYITSDMCKPLFLRDPNLRKFPEIAEYLLISWVHFLFKNTEELSIYRRLDKHINLEKNSNAGMKKYLTEMLNKNSIFSFSKDNRFYNEINFDNDKMESISRFMSQHREGNRQGYKKSDSNLLSKLAEIERSKNRNNTEVEYGGLNLHTNNLLSVSLQTRMIRKLVKLSLEWIKIESEKPDSPISGWIFLMDYLTNNNRLSQPEKRNRIDLEINRPKLWKEQKTFSNGSLYSPITDSEYRHVKRKFLGETGTTQIASSQKIGSEYGTQSGVFNIEYYPSDIFKRQK
ncbi:hypothetical protein [Xenorhabdus sp. KJ12.1]|uniref:hypothetical protein n=1 Tax=Xenorhabdus sp. KJ12.1 TaxID=1851571 RepID=UPI000C04915E|nr:hypothetical protein [Xenorhabdus sp. KJ12.1]PHM70853.1 hypothetical protein Xekj_01662 [Xenorhabdus sp. KJ12.1]